MLQTRNTIQVAAGGLLFSIWKTYLGLKKWLRYDHAEKEAQAISSPKELGKQANILVFMPRQEPRPFPQWQTVDWSSEDPPAPRPTDSAIWNASLLLGPFRIRMRTHSKTHPAGSKHSPLKPSPVGHCDYLQPPSPSGSQRLRRPKGFPITLSTNDAVNHLHQITRFFQSCRNKVMRRRQKPVSHHPVNLLRW